MNSKSFKLQKPSFFLHQATMLQQTFQFLQETQLFLGYDFWHLQLLLLIIQFLLDVHEILFRSEHPQLPDKPIFFS